MDLSANLSVDDLLHRFVEKELLPGTKVEPANFWAALERLLADFTPKNRELLAPGRGNTINALDGAVPDNALLVR